MRSNFDVDSKLSSSRASSLLNVESAALIGSETRTDTSSHRKEALAIKSFVITADMTNETFAAALCNELSAAGAVYDSLRIVNTIPLLVSLHPCVATAGGSVWNSFSGTHMVIDNWSHLPHSLSILSCIQCRFGKSEAGDVNNDGWDSNGMVSWTEVFAHMPGLSDVSLAQSILPASLPTSLPASIMKFDVSSCRLTGTISSTLIAASNVPSLFLALYDNQISGTLPSNLFAPVQSNPSIQDLKVWFHGNNINGSIPVAFLDPLAGKNLPFFDLRLDSNRGLSGPIPTDLIPSSTLGTANFYLRLDKTNISGTLPEGFFSRFTSLNNLRFYAGDSQITGPLPNKLFGVNFAPASGFIIDLSNAKLNGTIPPGFISGNLQATRLLSTLELSLANNDLDGPIPSNLLWNEVVSTKKKESNAAIDTWSSSQLTTSAYWRFNHLKLRLSGNRLNGSIPAELLVTGSSFSANTGLCSVNLDHNMLSGSVPPQLLAAVSQASNSAEFKLNGNQLSGSLPPCPLGPKFTLQLQDNLLSGSIPPSWANCIFAIVGLDSNIELNGTIPTHLFNTTGLVVFTATNTSFDGDLPPIGTTMRTLTLTNTNFNFCSLSSIESIAGYELPSGSCDVRGTSACDCVEVYTPCFSSLNDSCPIMAPSEPAVSPSISPATTPNIVPDYEPVLVPTSPPSNMTPEEIPSSPVIPMTPFDPNAPSIEPNDTPTSSSASIVVTYVLIVTYCVAMLLFV